MPRARPRRGAAACVASVDRLSTTRAGWPALPGWGPQSADLPLKLLPDVVNSGDERQQKDRDRLGTREERLEVVGHVVDHRDPEHLRRVRSEQVWNREAADHAEEHERDSDQCAWRGEGKHDVAEDLPGRSAHVARALDERVRDLEEDRREQHRHEWQGPPFPGDDDALPIEDDLWENAVGKADRLEEAIDESVVREERDHRVARDDRRDEERNDVDAPEEARTRTSSEAQRQGDDVGDDENDCD